MSKLIQCDACKEIIPKGSCIQDGDYHEVVIDQKELYHFCRKCYKAMMADILRKEPNCVLTDKINDPIKIF